MIGCICLNGQSFLGYNSSLYAGVNAASYNPATVADNVYSTDILAAGLSFSVANDYVGLERAGFLYKRIRYAQVHYRENDRKKSAFGRAEILFPGIMVSRENSGWAVDAKFRNYFNMEGVDEVLAHAFITGFRDPADYISGQFAKHIGVTQLSWLELGAAFARTWPMEVGNYLSVGVRPKLLLGLSAGYIFVNTTGYQILNDSTMVISEGQASYAHSDNFIFAPSYDPDFRLRFNPGLGADLGFVYEYRPADLQPKDPKDESRCGYNKRKVYKYRLAVSILDMGMIRFKKGKYSSGHTLSASQWNIKHQPFDSTAPGDLYRNFGLHETGKNAGEIFWMRTPLTFNAYYDYLIRDHYFINVQTFAALYKRSSDAKKVNELTRISITGRWENEKFGVWLPVSYTRMRTLSLGFGFRIGPLIIGTDDILNLAIGRKAAYNQDFYLDLKFPFTSVCKARANKKEKKAPLIDKCTDLNDNEGESVE
ncbi:MAG TPA: DUF5723 family protein [Bacteroidia bacterium]|nr:DUF5723 family protein [Bacteroidia bacterium]